MENVALSCGDEDSRSLPFGVPMEQASHIKPRRVYAPALSPIPASPSTDDHGNDPRASPSREIRLNVSYTQLGTERLFPNEFQLPSPDAVTTGFINDDVRGLPYGVPLEKPLPTKRRRVYAPLLSPTLDDYEGDSAASSSRASHQNINDTDLGIKRVVENEVQAPSSALFEACVVGGGQTPSVCGGQTPFVVGGLTPVRGGQTPGRDGQTLVRGGETSVRAGQIPVRGGKTSSVRGGQTSVRAGQIPVRGGKTSVRRGQTSSVRGAQSPTPRCRKRPMPQLARIMDFQYDINYGSEDDSEGEDDYNKEIDDFSTIIPRTQDEAFSVLVSEAATEFIQESADVVAVASPRLVSLSLLPKFGPLDFFKFEWRPLPVPPIPPTERREVFSETKCGPVVTFPTPYDAFIAIWSRDIMEYIATETNRYAQETLDKLIQKGCLKPSYRLTDWKNTNADELYVYFALLMATAMCVKSDLKEYWLKGGPMYTPNFAKYMTYRRFCLLSKCLHFAPNPSNIHLLSRPEAKLHKIEPIIKHLNSKFQSLYRPGRNVAIDESLTMWNGWLDIKQYIKNKAASVGIKTFELCETQTGYLWRFKVYTGPGQDVPEKETTPISGPIETLVLDLVSGLEFKGRTVWMNSYCNSPALARVLKSRGFDCVGTLNTNRRFVPKQLAKLKKSEMVIGQVSSCTSGDVDVMVWRDQTRVALLSTYHGAAIHTANGKTKPIAIHDYNMCMSGIDKKDQLLSSYPIERIRTLVWYKKLFRRLLNVSILNAFILHKHSTLPKHERISNHRDFRRKLISQVLEKHRPRTTLDLTGETKKSNTSRKNVHNVPVLTKEVLEHFPSEYGFIPGNKKERIRRSCVLCHKRVPTFCPACNVALCPFDCIKTYHN